MAIKIVVPELGESVLEATVSRWLKKEGDFVNAGDVLVELETDKVNLEVGAKSAGVLQKIAVAEGGDVKVAPGAIFRIKFVKPLTLPVIQQGSGGPRPIQQAEPEKEIVRKPPIQQ